MTESYRPFESAQGDAFGILPNRLSNPEAPWSEAQNVVLSDAGLARAKNTISAWPGYEKSPLIGLPALASELDVASLHYKDESSRFGLGSFKALGGAYAVARLLQLEIAKRIDKPDLAMDSVISNSYADIARQVTVCCATDGNHGRSVAWGATSFGCECVIFIHATVSDARRKAIEKFGATVVRTSGNYDDSVREAQRQASENGWYVVSDTSYPGYVDIPKDVMQGYELMVAEADEQMPEPPTHIFIQTGVGGVAAAVAGYFARQYLDKRPAIILADPDESACWLESLRAGEPTPVTGELDTMMAGLACGEVSLLAWTILEQHADYVVAIPDSGIPPLMRRLAMPVGTDPAVVAGESGVAGLLACSLCAQVADAREVLSLSSHSRVLVFGTEGDTDPELYYKLVGCTGEQVQKGQCYASP